jgi:formylglycine-generating enzyme required for sulfatase activity
VIFLVTVAICAGVVMRGRAPRHVDVLEFDDCQGAAWCPKMTRIFSGQIMMGSPADEPGRFGDEGPQHLVEITQQFGLAKYDVTRGQFATYVAETHREPTPGCAWAGLHASQVVDPKASWRDPGFPQEDTHPVVCVSFTEAEDYVRWLSTKTGKAYRLPTEAEWEFAAREGRLESGRPPAPIDHEHANYGADACCGPLTSGRDRWLATSPVGSFPVNALGLYDMAGNVWQWVADCYVESYTGAPSDGSARETTPCEHRVLRGGAWGDIPALLRPATRNWAPPPDDPKNTNYHSTGVGFRVARAL